LDARGISSSSRMRSLLELQYAQEVTGNLRRIDVQVYLYPLHHILVARRGGSVAAQLVTSSGVACTCSSTYCSVEAQLDNLQVLVPVARSNTSPLPCAELPVLAIARSLTPQRAAHPEPTGDE
jgi:hypothetical protein